MLEAACLCLLALALPCWAYPTETNTTCEEFARGTNFDPVNALGEWFNVDSFDGSLSANITIRELTSSQLQPYDDLFRRYSNDKSKLKFSVIYIKSLKGLEMHHVLVVDDSGNVDSWPWLTNDRMGNTTQESGSDQSLSPFPIAWKSVDGFLVLMLCSIRDVTVLSKTATPDKDRLQQVVANVGIKVVRHKRVY